MEPVPGTTDILPAEAPYWRSIEENAHSIFPSYGYGEIRTPIFERTEVFTRSLGSETDLVQKEMYSFNDRGGRSLTLRPEGTASVLRGLASSGLLSEEQNRVYYIGAMFRGERPAAGRKRQFHQIGAECTGKLVPEIDVELISMMVHFLEALGVGSSRLVLNTRGDTEDRQSIAKGLEKYFETCVSSMCPDCQRRFKTNILRILDCKNNDCQEFIRKGPAIIDLVGNSSKKYFDSVCSRLKNLGIKYSIEPRLVRGLDYYVHTVFEAISDDLGAQNAIAGGGRYQIKFPWRKKEIEGIGFAAGIERLLIVQEKLGSKTAHSKENDIYIVSLGENAFQENFQLAYSLRKQGYSVLMDLEGRGMKSQMRSANKFGARITLIRGEDELKKKMIICKIMKNSEQRDIGENEINSTLQDILR